MLRKINLIAIVCLFSLSCFGLNIKQKKIVKSWNKQISELNIRAKKKCGKQIKTTIDDLATTHFLKTDASAGGYCGSTLTAVASFCDDSDAKDIVLDNIKAIRCTAKSENSKIQFKITDKKLVVTFGKDNSNIHRNLREWIENNL